MSSCVNSGISISGSTEVLSRNRGKDSSRVRSSIGALQFKESKSNEFLGKTIDVSYQKNIIKSPKEDPLTVNAQGALFMSKALRWWEKSLQPNMVEIESAPHLVESLSNAGDKLVIVDFYSPGCGGCKALHPKMCQLAEMNPNALFLMVNFEEHKAMCHALHVHVLPFFRFYRGSEGRLCSFSCTNATINKFKTALAKHENNSPANPGPAKGLNESELLALAEIELISPDLVHISGKESEVQDLVFQSNVLANALSKDGNKIGLKEGNAMSMAA